VIVLGLDLSFTALGMVAIPSGWDLDMRRVERHRVGYELDRSSSPRDHLNRLRDLALDVRVFAIRVGASHVWAESLPTQRAFSVVSLAKLRCAVDLELYREVGLVTQDAALSSSRKLLLGKCPAENPKQHVAEALRARGADFADDDAKTDAFTVANWGLNELGIPCLTQLLWSPETKPTRRRAAA
jgi:hypothetical protein